MKRFLRGGLLLLAVLGGVVAVWPVGQTAYGWWSQRSLQAAWRQETPRSETPQTPPPKTAQPKRVLPKTVRPAKRRAAAPPLPTPHPAKRWRPTRLVIPDIGVDVMVVQGLDEASLRRGPGHDPNSDLPGEPGNCVIAGHRNVYGSWFYRLDELWAGSVIRLETSRRTYTYNVLEVTTVSETDTTVLRAPEGVAPRLTLVTCTLPHTSDRIIALAELSSEP